MCASSIVHLAPRPSHTVQQKQAQKRANDVLQSVHQEAQQATRRITDLLQVRTNSWIGAPPTTKRLPG